MKPSAEIPLHQLLHADFYASDSAGIHGVIGGDFETSHRVDFFAIIWFVTDGDLHYIDFKPYPAKKNLIYLLARNQVHALPLPAPQAKAIVLTKAFFDTIEQDELRLLFVPFNNEGLSIPAELVEPLGNLFDLILLENRGDNDGKLLHLYTSAFLMHLHRLSHGSATDLAYHDERLRKLFHLVSLHYKTQKLVDFYAGQIGLSAKRLNRLLKEKLGISVSVLIYNYTLIEAKREISHSTKSFKEIAFELGFRGQSYFTRFFKKQTGQTPEQFRQHRL